MVSLSSMLMAPVRGVVWLVKLPFVLVWTLLRYIGSCVYRAVAAVLSVPAYYLGRAGTRLKLVWTWTKTSASKIRLCLPLSSSYTDSGLKTLPPPEHEYDDSGYQPYPPRTGSGSGSRRRRHSDRKHRQAIAAALTKLLLEPCSPSDSDEDGHEASRSSHQEDIDERTIKLIMDLLKFSKEGDSDHQIRDKLTPEDLQALREHAQSKEQLESFIAEVDQISGDVDPSLLLTQRQKQQQSSKRRSPSKRKESGNTSPAKKCKTHKSGGGSCCSSGSRRSVNDDGSFPADEENKEQTIEDAESQQYTAPLRHRYTGDLSPVQESPEYKPEEQNYKELENDLNLALSKLKSEISELHVEEEVKEELVETQITHTVTVTSTQQLSDEEDNLFEDSHEEFPAVPKVNPSLGLKAGHDRRAVGAARRTRPPTRKTAAADQQGAPSSIGGNKYWQLDKRGDPVSEDSWDDDSDVSDGESEGECGDVPDRKAHNKRRPRKFSSGLQLSDQFQLLSPTSESRMTIPSEEMNTDTTTATDVASASVMATSEDVSSLYAKVNKKKKSGVQGDQDRPRTGSDPTPIARQSELTSRGSSHSMSSDYGDRDVEEKSGRAVLSNQPPWIEMRARRGSDSGAHSTTAALSASSQPPWIQMRAQKSNQSSSASTPTTSAQHPLHPQHTPHLASQSTPSHTHTTELSGAVGAVTYDLSGRVLPPKPSIPRPDPPSSTISSSAPLLETHALQKEKDEHYDDLIGENDDGEGFYDTLQPKEDVPQRESRIFPLHEARMGRPKYLHEVMGERERDQGSSISRSHRAGSLRIEGSSPALPPRNSGSQLKRTSSADTVRKPARKEGKQRHESSSSSSRGRQEHESHSRDRSGERRSSDGHRSRHRSSSGDRTPPRGRHHSSDKRGSTSSSSKGSPSPSGSSSTLSTMWKLLATPTSSRKRHSSLSKDSTSSKGSSERRPRRRNSSSPKDKDSPDH